MPIDSNAEYERLRLKLQELHRAAVPDLVEIDKAIRELEEIRWRIKAEQQGYKGNNPNE